MPLDKHIDFDFLAEAELAGGDIKNAILLSARRAIAQGSEKVTQQHLDYGLEKVLITKQSYEEESEQIRRNPADMFYKEQKIASKIEITKGLQ